MYRKALTSLTILFFMMGFITCLNDILVPFLKEIFELDYTQAAMVQFCFFAAYGLASIPASKMMEVIGYQKSMVAGFIITSLGCLLFFPAVSFHSYPVFLIAFFILACGVVILQVAANPFVSVIGPEETASSRLTMVQAFNSVGTFVAPFFGSYFILSKLDVATDASSVKYPYLFIAFVLVVIAIILSKLDFPKIEAPHDDERRSWKRLLQNPSLLMGMLGIFTYVGAEVTIGSFLVNYIIDISPMSETQAATYVALYWGGATIGRFLGIFTLKKFSPGKVLAVHSLLAIGLILFSISTTGMIAVYSLILVGLCNSIMFPTIFTLGIKGLDRSAQKASGLLATSILGGAILPVVTGMMADHVGLRISFILPALCYAYICLFGIRSR